MAETDLAALSAWMDGRGLGEGPLEDVATLSGGTQNILLRFRRADRNYVLRRPPLHPRPNSNETMRREARLLAALRGTDVPHPALIADCGDETVLGVAFYLMEPVDGFNATVERPQDYFPAPEAPREMGFALIDGIAALGAVDYRSVGLEGFGKPDRYLERQVEQWRRQLASYAEHAGWPGPSSLPAVEQVAAWLDRHRPASFVPGILHGDYHMANVMFRKDRPELAAIVDWELATIGDPLLDLGWVLATWPDPDHPQAFAVRAEPSDAFPSPQELVEHYRTRTVRDLSAIDWYAVLACYKLGIILEGTHARACAGKAETSTGERLHGNTIDLLERALRWIR